MPTGYFFSDDLGSQASRSGSSSAGSLTGTGAPSVPRGSTVLSPNPAPAAQPRTAGGSGYTAQQAPVPGSFGAFGDVRINTPATGAETGLYGLPGQNPNTEPSPGNMANWQMSGARSLVESLYGPQQTLLNQQLARQYDTIGMIGLDADYKTDALHRDNALANQLLGIDRRALGLDANLTKTQQANLGRLREILKKQYGLAGEQLGNQMEGFRIDEATARDMAKRNLFDLRSNLTSRGAFNTVANDRGTGRVNRDLMYQLGQIGVGRAGALTNYKGNLLGLDEKGIGYDNQAAQLANRLGNIGLDLERLGIKGEQLANQLNDGLHQIGLDSFLSINGLLDAIGSTNTQQAQLATTILTEVLGYANLPPNVLAELSAALGLTPAAPKPAPRPTKAVP